MRRPGGPVHAWARTVPREEDQTVVRPEDLLPDACEEAVAVVFREALDLPLEPGVHQFKVVQIKHSHFTGDDVEEFSLCRCTLHPAAGRPDGLYRDRPPVGSLTQIPGEGVDEEGADLIGAGPGGFVTFPAEESQDSLQDHS